MSERILEHASKIVVSLVVMQNILHLMLNSHEATFSWCSFLSFWEGEIKMDTGFNLPIYC